MARINYFYNFFPLNDLVQPIFGIFGRVYPEHPCIANIRSTLNGKEPDHDQLHSPWIAQWLTALHRHCISAVIDSTQPMIVDFTSNKQPTIALDTQREELLKEDRKLIAYLNTIFRKKSYDSEGVESAMSLTASSKIPLTNL